MTQDNPLVSVIIPTYNEERDIEACLASLRKQTYSPLEIIVVDDGSTDRTLSILKATHGIRLHKQAHAGPGAARNRGGEQAKGEILVFVDADMTFEKRFVDRLTQPIRAGNVIGTFSKEEYVTNPQNRWARCWSIERGWAKGRMHPPDHPDTQKVFRAIVKRAFDSVGGFTQGVGYTDDWTLADKLGQEALAVSGAVFFHRNPENLAEVYRQARWIAMRPYKLGVAGRIFALIRASFPVSFVWGIVRTIRHRETFYLIFKLVFDLASSVGVISLFFTINRAKK